MLRDFDRLQLEHICFLDDTIEALRAENERMREALQQIADYEDVNPYQDPTRLVRAALSPMTSGEG